MPSFQTLSYCTNFNVVKFRYVWKINNLNFCEKEIKSPVFYAEDLDTVKWQITLSWERSDMLRVKLQMVSGSNIIMKLPLSYGDNNKYFGLVSVNPDCNCTKDISENRNSFSSAYRITYDMEIFKDTVYYENPNGGELKLIDSKVALDISKLLDNGKFSDVILEVNGTEFRVHKAILASRSNVFAAMFEHNLKENITNRIEVTDLDEEVVEEMLRFIYTGKSPNLDRMLNDLLEAADKYALDTLKEICISKLAKSMDRNTAVQTLILADLHHADTLKGLAMDFINTNASMILKTEIWRGLKEEYPHLCIEIYERQHLNKGK